MEIARRLRAARQDVRCRQGHRVLQRPPEKLGVASGRPLCDFFSRRCPRTSRGAKYGAESDHEDRYRVGRLSYFCGTAAARATATTRFCSTVNDAKNNRTITTPSAAPNVRVIEQPPEGFFADGIGGATCVPAYRKHAQTIGQSPDSASRVRAARGQRDNDFEDGSRLGKFAARATSAHINPACSTRFYRVRHGSPGFSRFLQGSCNSFEPRRIS
jgi:hypothetical protein